MKKKILITGSAGFLFGNYIRRFIYIYNKSKNNPFNDIDPDIVSLDLLKNKSNIKHSIYNNKNHSFHIADIRDKNVLDLYFRIEKPDIVIHGASDNNNIMDMVTTNIIGTKNLLDKCHEYNCSLLYISETDLELKSKSSEYFATKLCSENFVLAKNNVNSNILRLPELYGPQQSRNEVIPNIIFNLNNNTPCYIENTGMIDRLHVFDACSAITTVLLNNSYGNVYNASNNDLHTDLDVALRIQSIMNKKDLVFQNVETINDVRNSFDSTDLLNIGWKPIFNLNNSLNDHCVQWYLKNNWFLK